MQVRIPEFDKEMCDVLAIDKTPAPGTEDSTRLELADKAAPPVSQTSGREASTGRHQDIHMPPKIDADVEETTSPLTKVSPEVAERRNPFSATGNTQNYPSQMTSVQPPVSAIRTPNPIGALSHPGRPMLQGLLDPTKIDPTAAIAAIIGYEKVQAILAGQRVEITLPWNIPSSNFALSEMPDIVVWQVDMYRQLATDDSNTHCVHTALQLAARQDLLLWMLASWLWSAHEVIMLPVPAGKQPRWTNKPLAAWTAFVHSNSIELPWCKLIWMPLAQISPEEHGVIAFANAQGSSVVYAQGQYQALAFHTFQDHRGVLFQHPHPVSRALLGAGRWNSPDTMLAMSELMDPRRTRAILAAHGRVMLSCMIDSAMRSLRIDAAYRREESYLADRVKLWAESNRAERTGNILNAVCRGVAVVPEISMLVANDSGAATGGYNILRSLPHVGETRSWVIYQGMEWANGEMVGSDPGPAVGGREETVHGKRPFGGSGQGAEGQRVRRKVG